MARRQRPASSLARADRAGSSDIVVAAAVPPSVGVASVGVAAGRSAFLLVRSTTEASLAGALAGLASAPRAAVVLVGPEGGLAPDEVEAARAAGWRTVTLGRRILRTETAGPAILAVLQARFGDLGAIG